MSTSQELIERRHRILGPAYRLFYDQPLHLVRAKGTSVWDRAGRRYLDAYNNVPSVGHCHPKVVKALSDQAALLNTHTRYLHETVVEYAERLVATFPPELSQATLTCTGSEANDLALRIARVATGNQGIIVTDFAYHGVTSALAEISPAFGPSNPLGKHVRLVPAPDSYRLGVEGAATAFQAGVQAAIADLIAEGFGVAALICDTVFASDGIFTEPSTLLAPAVDAVRRAGGLFIADEVQSGLARPGAHFWAFERFGVVPDIVTMGKPLGDGHPLAGLVARPELLAAFAQSARYFNTFGGNPVSAAVGLAVLDVIDEEGLQQNAARMGTELLRGLAVIAKSFPAIGDLRGAGLYATIELIEDEGEKRPSPKRGAQLLNLMRGEGVLVGLCGKHSNCLKIRPPLCFTSQDVDEFLAALERALHRLD